MRYTRQARQDILDIWLTIAPSRLDAADRVEDRCNSIDFPNWVCRGRRFLKAPVPWLSTDGWLSAGSMPQVVRVVDASRNLAKLAYPRD